MVLAWTGFIALIMLLLAIDLFLVNRKAHTIGAREALTWTAFYVAVALAFSVAVYFIYEHHWLGLGAALEGGAGGLGGREAVVQYLTGWMVEYALSMDNIFVISVILTYFRTPASQQHRVLFWGVLGAIIMRGAMIIAGTALIHAFDWMIYVFGLVLLVTAARLLLIEEEMDMESNTIIRLTRKYLPFSTEYEGGKFFTRHAGQWLGTPLLLVMIVVQVTDALFAFDSIPAVFAITQDSFLIFSSNMFAILGLRCLYFALAAVIEQFQYLKLSLVFVLAFIGAKMMIHGWVEIPAWVSMVAVASLLGAGVGASLVRNVAEKRRAQRPPIGELAQAAEQAWRRSRAVVAIVMVATFVLLGLIAWLSPTARGTPLLIIGLMVLGVELIWGWLLISKTRGRFRELLGHAERSEGTAPDSPQSSEAGETWPADVDDTGAPTR